MSSTFLRTEIMNPSYKDISLSQSHMSRFAVGLTAAALITTAVGLASASLPVTIVLAVATVAAAVFVAIEQRHLLIYDLSLLYAIYGEKKWWNVVSKDVILGGIPLEKHRDLIAEQGVTHVITLLDDFELSRGIVNPVAKNHWKEKNIRCLHVRAPDFEGVSISHIDTIVKHMRRVRRRNRRAKFYIHCKAGRGRSVTIAVVDRLLQKHRRKKINLSKDDLSKLIEQEIKEVQAIRPAISLNPRQRAAISAYFEQRYKR